MLEVYEDYLDLIETEAIKDGIGDFRMAREEFHNLAGKFEDGEPWFELRMNMFLDWCLLDRPGPDNMTPVARFLTVRGNDLNVEQKAQMEYLTVTQRSVFRLIEAKGDTLRLEDLARGGEWLVHSTLPTVGLSSRDILDARIVFFGGRPTVGRGIVLHPREAHEAINEIVDRAQTEHLPPATLVNHLDKMRLKLDRYSNVRIKHVYKYPGDAVL